MKCFEMLNDTYTSRFIALTILKNHRQQYLALIFFLISIIAIPLQVVAQQSSGQDSLLIVNSITYTGNKKTKDWIIAREIMFAEGDTLSRDKFYKLLEKSRENLLNTSLFNFVTTDLEIHSEKADYVDVVFNFTERWYIWPWPIVEFADRNFNVWWNENRDLSRLSYGVLIKWDNFTGRKDKLEVTTRFGYNELYGLEYSIPYVNRKETIGLGVGAGYGRAHEVPVINMDDELVYYEDDQDYVMHSVASYLSLIYRKEIYNTHTFRLEYNYRDYADTLIDINPGFIPGGQTKLQYLSFVYQYKSDFRDCKPYPLNGHYFDVELVKRGFNLLDNGSMDVFYILTTFRKYWRLGKRWYFASGLNSKFSNDEQQPFYMEGAVGYGRDIIRGYEYYVVNGQNFGIFKNNFKFALLPEREFEINFIGSEKFSRVHYAFYLNAFFDMGFVDNMYTMPELNNDLENTLLIGYGIGLDFVTYYDIVLRFEYSVNRMGEHGFYLHFRAPI